MQNIVNIRFNAFGSSDSQNGFGNDNEIIVNTNWDVLKGKIELDKVADQWYEENKKKLLEVDEINIPSAHSFGGLKAWAFLAAIAKDRKNGQKILDKIKNIALLHPLPSSEAKNIKTPLGWLVVGFLELMFQSYQRPSIIDYIEDIKKANCKLPNATVEHIYAKFDDMVKNDPKYPEQVADAFTISSDQSIVKKYSCSCYNCDHRDTNTGSPTYTHKDLLKNAMKKKSMEYEHLPLATLKRYNNTELDRVISKNQKPTHRLINDSFGPENNNQQSTFSLTNGSFGTYKKKGERRTISPFKNTPSGGVTMRQ